MVKQTETDIIEEDYMQQGGVSSPKELILRHIDRISQFIFKGDVNPTYKEGKEEIIPPHVDKRIVIIQAIEFAQALLKPFYDKAMENYQKPFDTLAEIIETNLLTSSINATALEKSKGDNDKFWEFVEFYKTRSIIQISKDSSSYEIYLIEKYSAYMKLFEQLNYLLKRKNYLEGEVFGER